MRALILTAGLGTRLRPLTFVRAKAAVPVNGEPIVRRVIASLVQQGLSDLIVNLHHRPESIAAVVGDGRGLGARVRYSWENPVLGSAGGPRHALPLLTDTRSPRGDRHESGFVLVNGDTLTNLPLDGLIGAHRSSGSLVTMALIPNPRPDVYGGVVVDAHGRVTGFTRRGATRTSFHFIGIQVASPDVFASLADGVPAESVMQVYPELIARNPDAVTGHIVDAQFRDIGTPADYWGTSIELTESEGDRLVSQSAHVSIDSSAEVRRTAIWDRVQIGARARLEDCIVCDGVRIREGSCYSRCAIAPYGGEALRDGERLENGSVIRPF